MNFQKFDIENCGINVISKDLALRYNLIPYKMDESNIYLFVSSKLSKEIIEEIEFITSRNVRENFLDEISILNLIKFYYNKESLKKNITKLKSKKQIEKNNMNFIDINMKKDDSPAVFILNSIIKEAITKNASDIHIEPFKNSVLVRIRINGDLIKIEEFPIEIYENIIYRIKILASMDISIKNNPQDGKIRFKFNGEEFDLRISSLPIIYGEKFVIRILYKNNMKYSLENIGFENEDVKIIRKVLKANSGMILLTGPTGSGKTTTLYSMILEMDRDRKNIVTVENPIEYEIEKVNQVNINPNIGLTFSKSLRNILRQDPDVIMVGEIIDEEAAQIAITASLTGHLILSTMHCNDTSSSIIRLIDMNIPKYLVVDSVGLVISQRLVKKLCNNCKKAYMATKEEIKDLEIENEEILFSAVGCDKCNYTGYDGRVMVYELVLIQDSHKNIIMNYDDINELRKYSFNDKGNSLKEKLKKLVLKGETTYEQYIGNLKLNYMSKRG